MSFGKTPSAYKTALERVRLIIDEWDPYALLENGAPADEYESLAMSVVGKSSRAFSAEDVVQAVSSIFSGAFEPEHFQVEQCREVGLKVFAALQDEGFVQ